MASKILLAVLAVVAVAAALVVLLYSYSIYSGIGFLLNPPEGLSVGYILLIAFILGILHGITPDEHTWPITFSYAVGSYSTKKGMKAGFTFSAGFTMQRALLTTLGFVGLAAIYKAYDLNGPVYIAVGVAMLVAGAYVLNRMRDLHIPFDLLLGGKSHHSTKSAIMHVHEREREIPARMALVHGLIAGFGFGAYATIITFVLAPQVPGIIYAPLVGAAFGIGTMVLQVAFGAIFATLAKTKKISDKEVAAIGRKTAGNTLFYGGIAFAAIGALIIMFPLVDGLAISTGNPIPNLDSVSVATFLVIFVVGVIGFGSLASAMRAAMRKPNSRKPGGRRG